MKKEIIAIIIIAILLVVLGTGCVTEGQDDDGGNRTGEQWEWILKYGWNEITFTQSQIDACGSDAPRDVFVSVIDSVDGVYQTQNGELKGWSPDLDDVYNSLKKIIPGVICDVHCTSDCVLIIS
jgi:hypothetical protein